MAASPLFPTPTGALGTADSKGLTGACCLQEGKHPGSAHSKGVRRTAWREAISGRAPSFAKAAAGSRRMPA